MHQTKTGPIDVAVIGGGIAGLACARELASAGRKIAVFEMAPRRGASWAAAGMLSPWAESPEEIETLEMRIQALALYPGWVAGLEAETGETLDVERCGSLVISAPGEDSVLSRLRCVEDRAPGFRALTAEEARIEAPLLGPEIGDAVLLPEEGYADPPELLRALRDSLGARGVILREEPVLRIVEEDGRARGVLTASEEIRAGAVLVAAGAWAGAFLPGPVRPIRGQLLSLRPVRGGLKPNRVIQSSRVYLVPRGDGSLVVGSTSEDAGFDAGVTVSGIRSLLERAVQIAPSLSTWALDQVWSGLRPYREGGPMIGPDPETPNLYHAVGLYRHGILLAPYVARRIRECIAA